MNREMIWTAHIVTDGDKSLKVKKVEEFTDSKAYLDFFKAVAEAKQRGSTRTLPNEEMWNLRREVPLEWTRHGRSFRVATPQGSVYKLLIRRKANHETRTDTCAASRVPMTGSPTLMRADWLVMQVPFCLLLDLIQYIHRHCWCPPCPLNCTSLPWFSI